MANTIILSEILVPSPSRYANICNVYTSRALSAFGFCPFPWIFPLSSFFLYIFPFSRLSFHVFSSNWHRSIIPPSNIHKILKVKYELVAWRNKISFWTVNYRKSGISNNKYRPLCFRICLVLINTACVQNSLFHATPRSTAGTRAMTTLRNWASCCLVNKRGKFMPFSVFSCL